MRTVSSKMPFAPQRGFSLVELMVAMTIGLVVLAGVGYVYLESRVSFRAVDNLSRMQESARYALEVMAHDIRMAGYRGCASSSGAFYNNLENGTFSAYNFEVPINGYDAVGAGWSPALPSDTGGLAGLGIRPGTDAIILRSASGSGFTVEKQPGADASADLKVTAPNDLENGDIVMATNCIASTVFQITNMNAAGDNVVHNTGTGTPGNSVKSLGENYSASGGELVKMESKSYFIRTGASGNPALWQFDNYKAGGGDNPAEIAEGVENMQIVYGVDTNGDGIVENYAKASAVADWKQVAAVRISLLTVGSDDNVASVPSSGKYKYFYDGAEVEAPDKRLRLVFTTTVSVRNRTQ